jgi:hypothetical protein
VLLFWEKKKKRKKKKVLLLQVGLISRVTLTRDLIVDAL